MVLSSVPTVRGLMGEFDGSRIRRARRLANDMTQGELARRLGVSQNTVSAYELGKAVPSAETLGRIAGIVGVPVSYFYPGDEEATLAELNVRFRRLPRPLTDEQVDTLVRLAHQFAARPGDDGLPQA